MKYLVCNQKGVSLIEAMVAMLIMLIGMLAIVSLSYTIIKTTSTSSNMNNALVLAQTKIEEFKSLNFAAPALVTGLGKDTNPLNPAGECCDAKAKFNRSWEIQSAANTGIKTINVFVRWTDGNGPHTVSLSTIRYKL